MSAMRMVLVVVHAVAGAVWVGAMVYSLMVVQSKAREFFGEREERERFLVTMAAGARWKVITAFGVVGASGAGLWWMMAERMREGWWTGIMAAKTGLWAAALGVFVYVSWVMWPRRIFAVGEEIDREQRRFRWVGRVMIGLVGAAFVLGVLGHG